MTSTADVPARARVSRTEWVFVLVATVIVLAVTELPYVYGYISAPPDKQFMGIMLDVPDHAQYFSWMRELSTSNLASNKLTPETNAPVFFNLLWWLMGHAGHFLGLGYAAMFQVLRIVATSAFLPLSYLICAWFLPSVAMRRLAFLLLLLSSGFGWLIVAAKYIFHISEFPLWVSLLVYIVEPNTFLAILSTPHLVGSALYMGVFLLILAGETSSRAWLYAVAAGLFAAFIGWQHTYDLILVYGVLGAYGLLKWIRDRRVPWSLVRSGIVIGVLSGPAAVYSVLLTRLDPIWRNVLAQYSNAGVYTPNLFLLPVLMGPALLMAVYSALRDKPYLLSAKDDARLFLTGWFWINLALLYIPTDYQIKMLNGWQVPTAILCALGLYTYALPALQRWLASWRPGVSPAVVGYWLAVGAVLVVVPTNVYLLAWRFFDLSRHTYPYYLSKTETEAMTWLESHAAPDDVVLSSETIGQYIPALTGTHAFLAHWAQTVDYNEKQRLVSLVFAKDTAASRVKDALAEYHVDYIIYGPAERQMGGTLPALPTLERVFLSGDVEIYAVHR